ncbi:MAG: TIGR03857 family LLM class F420-dependent oxidoreductase [Acidimicrobiia bacterium]
MTEPRFPELAFYTLAGAPPSTRAVIDEVKAADAMGLGFAFISERLAYKEAATVSGAAGAVSENIRIATAATNHNTRHPQITAAYATTMDSLTQGRFTLGLGRGFDRMFDGMGLPHITNAQLEDFAGIMRRLWAGEMIFGHDGPAGKYPYLGLSGITPTEIDLGFVAIGPKSLALGGKVFDQVVLHTFFSDEYTAKAVKIVKDSAEQAGRDPDAVKVWSCFATVGDHIPYELRINKTVGRLVTYMQGYGQLLVEVNGWSMDDLNKLRTDETFANFQGAIDGKATVEQLEHFQTLVPDEWLAPMAAGSPEQCVAAIRNQFALGCDGVIMHGANPTELAPIVEQYAKG